MKESVRALFPADMQWLSWEILRRVEHVREIRMRAERPVIIRAEDGDFFIDARGNLMTDPARARYITAQEMEKFFMHICNDSPYAYEDALRQGFLTAAGGHRIGISGETVQDEKGGIRTIRHIYYINIRIAHQIRGAADSILPYVYENGTLKDVLIISPPGCGKTTMLRDLVRQISDGNRFGAGMNVAVVDERSELAGCFMGIAQNDLGMRTDVLDACPKTRGMMMLLRSMAPQVLAVDEIGDDEDMLAIRSASACGCRVIATMHGAGPEDIGRRFHAFSGKNFFDRVIVLRGRIGKQAPMRVYRRKEEGETVYENVGSDHDPVRLCGDWKLVSESV